LDNLTDTPMSSGSTSVGRRQLPIGQTAKPDRDTVCSHSERDATLAIPVTNVMSQAPASRMESWRDTTFQRSILVVGVGPLLTLHSFRTGPVLIAHIILIDVQRLTPDFRTVLVALLSNLRLIVLLG